jgi:hypothetical protein
MEDDGADGTPGCGADGPLTEGQGHQETEGGGHDEGEQIRVSGPVRVYRWLYEFSGTTQCGFFFIFPR